MTAEITRVLEFTSLPPEKIEVHFIEPIQERLDQISHKSCYKGDDQYLELKNLGKQACSELTDTLSDESPQIIYDIADDLRDEWYSASGYAFLDGVREAIAGKISLGGHHS